jgi:hypothetical protein
MIYNFSKISVLSLFFLLSFFNLKSQSVIGGAGVCHVSGNPNSISPLTTQDLRAECLFAWDTVGKLLYVYDHTLPSSSRWNLINLGDRGEIVVNSLNQWTLDTVSRIRFYTNQNIADSVGVMRYNNQDGTVHLGMGYGNVSYQLGQELFYPPVINKSGSIIYNGQLVMVDPVTSLEGDKIRIVKAVTNGTYPSDLLMGVATMDIPIDGDGLISYFGYVREIVESNIAQNGVTLNVGEILYPSPTEPGKYTNVPPVPPANNTPVAFLVRKPSVNNVTLLVRYNKSQRLSELDDVILTSPANNALLYHKDGLWRDTLISNIVTGTGNQDQLAYFTGSTTLGSLSTATYPSLAELIYLKGVTGSIQTQLNGKLSTTLNSGQIFVGNVSNVAAAVTMSGDATISNTGVLAIGTNKVTSPMLRQSVAYSVIGNTGATTANVTDITAADHQVLRRSGTSLGFGQIALNQSAAVAGVLAIANGGTGTGTAFSEGSIIFAGTNGIYNANSTSLFWSNSNTRLGIGNASPQRTLHVTGEVRISDLTTVNPTKLIGADANGDLNDVILGTGLSFTGNTLNATSSGLSNVLASGRIFVGNASNVATDVAMSGDATINNTGILTIANNAVSNEKIRQSGVYSVIGNASGSTANVADISAALDHQVLRRSGTSLGFGQIALNQSNAVAGTLGVANGGTGAGAFTQGSVVFAGASGVYSQNNANFFWNNSTSSLGIGTNTPRSALEVFTDQIIDASNVWTARTTVTGDRLWESVTYGNGLFVAVASSGTGNRIMTSPDGINWTLRISPADHNWKSVTYGEGLFVAVASTGTNRVMTSPDGINWTLRTPSADLLWSSVTYGNGLFVAVAQDPSGNVIMTSPDGITWTARTPPANNTWNAVTFGNGIFVAVGSSGTGNRVMRSTDGITWTTQTSASNITWRSVTYGKGLFVAVGLSGANVVMTSPDGITWTGRSISIGGWRSVCYGNGMFVAVAVASTGNPAVATSIDGIAWVLRNTPSIYYYSVTYANGMFVAVGLDDDCMTSGVINTTVTPHNNQYNGTHEFTQNVMIGSNAAPQRTLHVTGDVRITDLTTDNPTKLVGVDNEGDLSEITLGTGLSFSGTTLNASGSSSDYSEMYLTSTVTLTLSTASTKYNITNFTAGLSTSNFNFSNNNRLTYTGSTTKKFKVTATGSFEQASGTTLPTMFMEIMENGSAVIKSRQQITPTGETAVNLERVNFTLNMTSQAIIELATNDYIEVALSADLNSIVINIRDLNLIIEEL